MYTNTLYHQRTSNAHPFRPTPSQNNLIFRVAIVMAQLLYIQSMPKSFWRNRVIFSRPDPIHLNIKLFRTKMPSTPQLYSHNRSRVVITNHASHSLSINLSDTIITLNNRWAIGRAGLNFQMDACMMWSFLGVHVEFCYMYFQNCSHISKGELIACAFEGGSTMRSTEIYFRSLLLVKRISSFWDVR